MNVRVRNTIIFLVGLAFFGSVYGFTSVHIDVPLYKQKGLSGREVFYESLYSGYHDAATNILIRSIVSNPKGNEKYNILTRLANAFFYGVGCFFVGTLLLKLKLIFDKSNRFLTKLNI